MNITIEQSKQLLDLYKDDEDGRYPGYLWHSGFAASTELHIMIVIPDKYAPFVEKTEAKLSFLRIFPKDGNCEHVISIDKLKDIASKIELIDETKKIGEDIKCKECDGEGDVEYEYRLSTGSYHFRECDCPICDGDGYSEMRKQIKTGNKIPNPLATIKICKGMFYYEKIEYLIKTMDILNVKECILSFSESDKGNLFLIDEIKIIIMPIKGVDFDFEY